MAAADDLARLADEVVAGALPGPEFSKRLDGLSPTDTQALASILDQKRASYSERSEFANDQARIAGLALKLKQLPDGEWESVYEALSEGDKVAVATMLRDSARGA